jgi:hypothetical protein
MTREQQIIEILELVKSPPRKPFGVGSKLDEEIIVKRIEHILKAQDEESSNEECKHEFVMGEYISQPYGTCLVCGRTIIK